MKLSRVLVTLMVSMLAVSCTSAPTPTPTLASTTPTTVAPTFTPRAPQTSTPTATATTRPTETPTATATRRPTFAVAGLAPDQYPDAGLATDVIAQYANAMNLKPDTIVLKSVQIKDRQGRAFIVAVTTDGTPLLLADNNGSGKYVWQKTTLRGLGEIAGIKIGTSVDGAEAYQTAIYRNTAAQEFSILMPSGSFMTNTLARYGDGMAKDFASLANANNMTLRIHPLFWHQDIPDSLKNASPSQVETYMYNRARQLMSFAKQLANDDKPVEITFACEARWFYNGNFGWEKSPYFTAFGENWVTKAYVITYRVAQENGLTVGKDVSLNYQDYGIEAPGADDKLQDTIQLLKRVKQGAAQELGIKEEDVNLDVGMNFHVHADPENKRGWIGPYTQDLFAQGAKDRIISIMHQLNAIGPVRITEFDVSGTSDLATKAKSLQIALSACLDSQVCRSFTVFTPLRFESDDDISLFNPDYSPTIVYYAALQILFEHIGR